ncbi:MAG: MBL fold metallo-hydrolase [Gemmobacter sp.]
MTDRFEITAYGARGTLPPPWAGGSVFGVNTSCVAVRHGTRIVILDAGTGIVPLGWALAQEGPCAIDIVLSHAHYDHVMGLPFFTPLHDARFAVTLHYAGSDGVADGAALMDALMRPPFLPFGRRDLKAQLTFAALPISGTVDLGDGTALTTAPVCHPGGALALRLERGGRRFVHVPDFEADFGAADAALIALLRGADLVFLDATYTPDDYCDHRGYGHAHWERCAEIAAAAGLRRCGLFHHAAFRTDADLMAIEAAVQAVRPGVFAVREGVTHRL